MISKYLKIYLYVNSELFSFFNNTRNVEDTVNINVSRIVILIVIFMILFL